MIFSSNIFLYIFLPFVLGFYFTISKSLNIKNYILLIFSLIFYSFGEINYLWLLTLSVIANYFWGIFLEKKLHHNSQKKLVIFLAITFNIGLLAFFKYSNFLIKNFNNIFNLNIDLEPIVFPLGISFFTFHAISYLVDIYRNKCLAQRNFAKLALYICFFPQLIAGPIVRYNFIAKYLTKRKHFNYAIAFGIKIFIIGLAKKVIIANPMAEIADVIFNASPSDINRYLAMLGIFCYSLQIYFDFSGYSDMAYGLARIFGFRFPKNFNYPYIALSIKDFWRRWHISLSTWFRDYVYIPLGGNKVSFVRQYFNLILVFFLCGLWHGASWNFVIWGLFHGIFLVLERFHFFKKLLNYFPKIFQNLYMLIVVMMGWVLFRSSDLSSALIFYKILLFDNVNFVSIPHNIFRLVNSHFFQFSLAVALLSYHPFLKNYLIKLIRKYKNLQTIFDIILLLCLFFVLIRLSSQTYNPFIYFQF
ncbi:alginate O-acetyltransferase [Alphaproteobacteria bacterium]|nr:alginate O-acetyltransferase [Alphaproteobacteria bacterium]